MIEVKNLTKSYGGIAAIKNLTFTINKGEVVGFLGPNGAGKSTTMKIITGFMAPTTGVAKVGGIDVFENPIDVKKKIGYLPETPPVYTDMYVKDYLTYVAKLKGVQDSEISAAVQRSIAKTQLQSVQNRLIQNLSKGFKQRVGIAQAIVSDPEVLILDEPTVGLDPKQVAEIRDLIQELKGKHTIILSTHVLSEVQATCERIIIINKGEIVAEDTLANLSKLKTGSRKVILKVRRPNDSVYSAIKSIAEVSDVHFDKANTYQVTTSASDEIIEAIATAAIGKNAGLLEISSAKADLEDIFIKLTYGDSAQTKGEAHV
jgi:ABC-2 type transport system ATP-binding protein